MNPDMVAELLRQLMKESMLVAAPVLVAAAVLSFAFSLVQTLTSLQDQSLTSVRRKTEGTPARASLAQCFAAMVRRY